MGPDRETRAEQLLNEKFEQLRKLRTENRELKEALAEAQARADAQGGYQVFIVPGERYVASAMEHLEHDASVRDGDRLRVAGTVKEWVYRSGTWESVTLLSTPEPETKGPREKIMTDREDKTLKLRPIDTGGATWEAHVDDRGFFYAKHPEHGNVSGTSYDALVEAARRATTVGRVKVRVPFAHAVKGRSGWRIAKGHATGIHGSTGNVLLDEEGSKRQSTMGTFSYFSPPTDEDAAEMIRLLTERDAADEAYKALVEKYRFQPSLDRVTQDEVERAKRGAGNEDA
jgi:hypothetical protein